MTLGNGTGFIQYHGGETPGSLQGFTVSNQYTKFSCLAHTHHDRNRRRQAQRTGTGNNQYRHGSDQHITQLRLRPKVTPGDKSNYGNNKNRGNKNSGDTICQAADGRFGILCLTHHFDNARQGGVFADAGCLKQEGAGLVDGAAHHFIVFMFFYRQGFTGQHRLIN